MNCVKGHVETGDDLEPTTGVPMEGAGQSAHQPKRLFHCPNCGRFVNQTLTCKACGSDWHIYEHLVAQYPDNPEVIDQMLEYQDLRAAILPPVLSSFDSQQEDVVALTPITPDMVEAARLAGKMGVGILAGGDDVEDMHMQATIYKTPKGKEQAVLYMKIRADLPFMSSSSSSAEDKIMLALETKEPKYMTVTEQEDRFGQLPYDTDNQIGAKLLEAIKSFNHHFGSADKDGEWRPKIEDNTLYAENLLNQLEKKSPLSEAEKAMIAHYRATIEDLKECIQRAKADDKDNRKKSKQFKEFEGAYSIEVQKKVEIPADPNAQGLVATKINGILDITESGVLNNPNSLDSTSYKTNGYRITLDAQKGWYALYYPHKGNDAAYSMKGVLEVITPEADKVDEKMVSEAVYRLRQMNLTGSLASNLDAEYLYLARNAWAMGLGKSPEFKKIMTLTDADAQKAMTLCAEEVSKVAIPEWGDNLPAMAQNILLKSYQRVKLGRRQQLRKLIADKLGITTDALVGHPMYMKHISGTIARGKKLISSGFMAWTRMDIALQASKLDNVYCYSNITGDSNANLTKIIKDGVMACTLRREMHGIHAGSTMSPAADMETGGAGYTFHHIQKGIPHTSHPTLIWKAATLACRSDGYWYPSDHYGAINPNSSKYTGQLSTDIQDLFNYTGGSSEAMFKNGVSILGQMPYRIVCGSNSLRDEYIKHFKSLGITEHDGEPIESIVVTST